MFLPFSAEATPPVCREDVPGLLWINTLGGFFLSRLLSARNLRAKVQQKNDMCKEMPFFLSKRTKREPDDSRYARFFLHISILFRNFDLLPQNDVTPKV